MYTLMVLGNTAKVPTNVLPFLVVILLLGGAAHIANRIFVPNAVAVVLPIAFLLNGIGYVMIARIDLGTVRPGEPALRPAPGRMDGRRGGGLRAHVDAGAPVAGPRPLPLPPAGRRRGAPPAPLVPHFGQNIQRGPALGARRILRFQPVEIAKIVLCIFFASYFAEKRELLTIPTARFGNRLVLDPRPLVPIVLAWLFAIGVMSLEHDIGFSALLFTLFIGLLWVTTGRTGYLVLGVVLFGIGAYFAGRYLSQTNIRVQDWLDPWKLANGSGRQLVQSWYALGQRGHRRIGLGLGQAAYALLPTSNTDFIFAVIGEEMGLLGSTMVVVAFLLLVGTGPPHRPGRPGRSSPS